MIKLNLIDQIVAIINSVFLGGFLTLIYDLFSFVGIILGIKRCKIKKAVRFELPYKKGVIKKIALVLLDVIYCLLITPICAIFLYSINFGILRWYYVIASIVGVIIYRASIGIGVKAVLTYVGTVLRCFLNYTLTKASGGVKKIIGKIKIPKKKAANKNKERKCICSSGAMKIKRQS